MNYATIKWTDIANGEGVRISLFVSGCTHHCKNCFNKIAWDFDYGEPFDEKVQAEILEKLGDGFLKNHLSFIPSTKYTSFLARTFARQSLFGWTSL